METTIEKTLYGRNHEEKLESISEMGAKLIGRWNNGIWHEEFYRTASGDFVYFHCHHKFFAKTNAEGFFSKMRETRGSLVLPPQ